MIITRFNIIAIKKSHFFIIHIRMAQAINLKIQRRPVFQQRHRLWSHRQRHVVILQRLSVFSLIALHSGKITNQQRIVAIGGLLLQRQQQITLCLQPSPCLYTHIRRVDITNIQRLPIGLCRTEQTAQKCTYNVKSLSHILQS